MTGLVVTLVVLAVIAALITVAVVVAIVVARKNDSPKERYGRTLRSIRRIRGGTRAGDPNATQIGPNRDAVTGYRTGMVGR